MESTLSLKYSDYAGEVGFYLGWGRGTANGDVAWTAQQQITIDSLVATGIRTFNVPPAVDQDGGTFSWSFLRPTATISLAAGKSVLPLPDDFAGFEGALTISSPTGNVWWPIELVNEGQVRELYARSPTITGRPMLAAEQWTKGTGATAGQRAQLYVYPIADTAYQFQVQYYLLPDYVSGAFPYPYGGAAHSETIKAACLAAAELFLDNMIGPMHENFKMRLSSSMAQDRKSKPQRIGRNRDNSDTQALRSGWNHWGSQITVNGVQY